MPIIRLSLRRIRLWLSGVLLALGAAQASAQEDLLGRALADLEAGNAQAAFDRLTPEQSRRAGNPDYDYLLGLAALGAGRNTEAVFALERVLALRPADLNARVAMGRAHLALQETDAARREFQTVQNLDKSPATRALIQRYLNVTDQLESAARFSAQIYLEFTLGHDSNVNSASDLSQVAIPGLGGINFTVDEGSRPQKDTFHSLSMGFNVRNRLSARTALLGGFTLSRRNNLHETNYDTETLDVSLGVQHTRSTNVYGITFQVGQVQVDHPDYTQGYRDSAGLTAQWLHILDGGAQWANYYQIAVLDYPGQEPRDALRQVLGTAYAKGFDTGVTGFAGLYAGIEKEDKAAYAAYGHELAGLRLGGDYAWSNRIGLFVNGSYEYRRYRGEDATFEVWRHDRQYSAALGLHYALPAKGWRLSPQLNYVGVDSNVPINSYDRWVAQMSVRGEF